MNNAWLPEGHVWDLHIEHDRAPDDAGQFTGGGWKLVWHVTVSPWQSVDAMVNVLNDKRAQPHFVIGGRKGVEHPVVVQLLPLDVAGRALQHPSGPETNRANAIQVEICAYPDAASASKAGHEGEYPGGWTDWTYKALANLAVLVEHRVNIARRVARSFESEKRFTGAGFVKTTGHLGHQHVPQNTHWDPGSSFSGTKLLRYMGRADGHGGNAL
jgi:hypothetical protein